MSDRKPSAFIKDILNCTGHIGKYIDGLTFEEFAADFMVVESCLYNIQVIGEAVARLPDDIKESQPQIPWASIKGMRNRLLCVKLLDI